MRFWADRPDLVIPVQWYFSDGQPYVPDAGPFRSRLFHKEDEVNWADGPMFPGLLGEDYASDRIRNVGNRPAWLANVPPPRAGKFCGSPRAWRGEGLFSLDPPLAPSPDGTSLCCGYENVTIDGSVAGGGGPGGSQGGGKNVAGTLAGGGSPESPQRCAATQLTGGVDCSSSVSASLGIPYETDASDDDQWYVFPTLPAGTYRFAQLCDMDVGITVYTGTCSTLDEQLTLCPGAAGDVYSIVFDLDGATDLFIAADTSLSPEGAYAVWAILAGDCPPFGYALVGAIGGGGRPQSIASGFYIIVGTVGGGGSPEGVIRAGGGTVGTTAGGGSPQSPFAAFYLYAYIGTVAGGGGPESPQGGM